MNTETKHTPSALAVVRVAFHVARRELIHDGHRTGNSSALIALDQGLDALAEMDNVRETTAKEIAQLKVDRAELVSGLRGMIGDVASGYDLCTCDKCKGQIVDRARELIAKHSKV